MTAALGNTAQGTPFATGVDAFVYPQFIGYALRAPTTQDIYNPGTRWQNNAVNPAVQYYTTGAGFWYEYPNTSFGVASVTGTANQILASPTVGSVVLSLIGPYTPATYTAHGVLIGAGTSSIVASAVGATGTVLAGNTGADPTFQALTGLAVTSIAGTANQITASAATGAVTLSTPATFIAPGSIAATTTVTATLGNITATAGNFVSSQAGNGIVLNSAATSGTTTATLNG